MALILPLPRPALARLPDAAITTDIIVGFPGETEEQFQNSLKLMETVRFDTVNTAAYSPRPNTPAAAWENQISEEVKADRLQRVNRLAKTHALERSERYLGREVEVLVEERNVKQPEQVGRAVCPSGVTPSLLATYHRLLATCY